MKPRFFDSLRPAFVLAGLTAAAAGAAPLPGTTAVQTRPEADAPAIGYLKAGSEPVPADAPAPEGWQAVSLPGPFSAYVRSGDLSKGLDVRPGASLYLEPKADAQVLTLAAAGDKIAITGLFGKWTQVQLDKSLTGYIHAGPLPPAPAAAGAPAPGVLTDVPAAAPAPPPANGPGRAVDTAEAADPARPRLLEGKLVASPHHLLQARPPYDWELEGPDGHRLAFVDLSKLLLTEQIDQYIGREVEVSGVVRPVPGAPDLVIAVETLALQ
jgi:hypothetical protein